MDMAIIIALAERQAKAVELECIETRELFEVTDFGLLDSENSLTRVVYIGRDHLCSVSNENH